MFVCERARVYVLMNVYSASAYGYGFVFLPAANEEKSNVLKASTPVDPRLPHTIQYFTTIHSCIYIIKIANEIRGKN